MSGMSFPAGTEFVDGASDGYLLHHGRGKVGWCDWRWRCWCDEHPNEGHFPNHHRPTLCTANPSVSSICLVDSARRRGNCRPYWSQCWRNCSWIGNDGPRTASNLHKCDLQQERVSKGLTVVAAFVVVSSMRKFVYSGNFTQTFAPIVQASA